MKADELQKFVDLNIKLSRIDTFGEVFAGSVLVFCALGTIGALLHDPYYIVMFVMQGIMLGCCIINWNSSFTALRELDDFVDNIEKNEQ